MVRQMKQYEGPTKALMESIDGRDSEIKLLKSDDRRQPAKGWAASRNRDANASSSSANWFQQAPPRGTKLEFEASERMRSEKRRPFRAVPTLPNTYPSGSAMSWNRRWNSTGMLCQAEAKSMSGAQIRLMFPSAASASKVCALSSDSSSARRDVNYDRCVRNSSSEMSRSIFMWINCCCWSATRLISNARRSASNRPLSAKVPAA